jgi:predicted component of type VI protein secretion system
MQVLLRIANGKSNVRKVRIQSDTVIGRSPECQLKVASNQISRRHCQIVIRDTVVAIKDLGSANGTFVNGRQVPPEVEIPLTPGTRVMLGPLQFTVEYDLPGVPVMAASVPAVAAAVPVTAPPVLQEHPQVQVETLHVVPPDGQTPFPPMVVVPEQQVPSQSVPQYSPPAAAPVAAAGVSIPAPIAPQVIPQEIPAAQFAAPAAAVVAATPLSTPQVQSVVPAPAVSPPAVPAAVAPPAPVAPVAPVAPQFFAPAVEAPAPAEEEDSGAFNFGIFAASGSDVVVESPAEMPLMSEPVPAEAANTDGPKPARKSLLQMFGWGKKKAPEPDPEPEPEAAAEPEPNVVYEEVVMEETVVGEALSFDLPAAEDAVVAEDDSSDESLQNFFNNFK